MRLLDLIFLFNVDWKFLDTEEASETDMGHHEEPLEIKEQWVVLL